MLTAAKKNIKEMRFDLSEISGGLGDLGTFIPLVAALTIASGMDLAMILIIAGLFNIITGILFGLPIPVQPMKAIAAVAIAENLLPGEIAAAGLIAGGIVFLLGVTNLIEKIETFIPKAVIRGIQLGIGLKLILKAFEFISSTPVLGLNSIVMATILGVTVILLRRFPRFPTALILFLSGLVVLFTLNNSLINEFGFSLPEFKLILPNSGEFLNGFLYGAVPQIPLTLLNSVLAVCLLTTDLFPGKKVSTSKMATSVGIMNLCGCWLGGMPMCHGSGGLAGQFHFGARTGGSVVILGAVKLVLGVFFGAFSMTVISQYPLSILGVMLFFAGLQLALPAKDQNQTTPFIVMTATAGGILAVNTLTGVLIGIVLYLLLSKISR